MASWNFSKIGLPGRDAGVDGRLFGQSGDRGIRRLSARSIRPAGPPGPGAEVEVVARVRVVRAPEPEPEGLGAGPVGPQADLRSTAAGA